MRKTSNLLLLLLALWAGSSHELTIQEETNKETSERVLIRSKRRWVLSTFELEEEDPGPFPRTFTTLYNDKDLNHTLKFSISGQGVDKEPKGVFSIDENTGEVFIHKPIDREIYPVMHVNFDVMEKRSEKILDKTLAFDVTITDKNDNPPEFIPEDLYIDVPENIKEGQLPVSLQARDNDEENNHNSRISMRIVSQEPALPKISLESSLDGEGSMNKNLVLTGCFDYDLNAEVMEMETREILRIPVEDKDTPNTPASRAVFTILKGNEEGNYKIETDPLTNEGVLTVIKGKDYERTTLTELEIGVENEEPLFLCIDGKPIIPVPETLKGKSTVKVAIKVIDVNDPPKFQNKIQKVYRVEEEEPGDVLYIPTVTDEDSDPAKLRYELVEDPAKWMSIDPQTGKITLAKKMDRESPYVHNSTYTVTMRAIDDGEPPCTGTGTLVVHLGDKNDNVPHLTSNTSVMCGNKADRVSVKAGDDDVFPYSGPFTFTFGKENQELNNLWKVDPITGSETFLISLKSLPYGKYSVPLKIADQQGMLAHDVLQVVVCDCGKGDVCRDQLPRSSTLHGAAIGILLGTLLMMALLLCFSFICKCKEKTNFKQCFQDDGNQTMIKYNEEGGFPLYKFEPQIQHSTTNHFGKLKTGINQISQVPSGFSDITASSMIFAKSPNWTRNRNSAYNTTRSGFSRSFSLLSEQNILTHLEKKLYNLSMEQQDFSEFHPHDYQNEGTNTTAVSLDKLSFHSTGDDLDFLQNLGPEFFTLDKIFQQGMKEKTMKF
ncbi:cadherin-like protein 26 isoform X3 [Neoarius graeffei]|uniref:cadherin-like protein 26 isoform X3 n=1 Tax=Neoarius graeffei TaxID=443677 RepID=UPI00298BEC86|nr:cadherin-like protein 26 isoform X3 [Neoarius graeffei]